MTRAAQTGRAALPSSPGKRTGAARIHRTILIVTVLSEGPLEHTDLLTLAENMHQGDLIGATRWTPSAPLEDDDVLEAETDVGGDGSFFETP